ncbi:MAG: HipA N-terminal domain-containing protein [Campylobacterales bacterium]|nr:HipA N-terminal domain-containing protein [Campylobacterales bacterium]
MKKIDVIVDEQKVGELFYEQDKNSYGFNYTTNHKPISLIMPYRASTYNWKYKLHPIFDMNMPEKSMCVPISHLKRLAQKW